MDGTIGSLYDSGFDELKIKWTGKRRCQQIRDVDTKERMDKRVLCL